jgi:hypothetical protein
VDFYFLLFSLFFPRLVMVVYLVLFPNLYPANTVPWVADLLVGMFVPRVLILIYIYQNMGYNNIWFAAPDRHDPRVFRRRPRNPTSPAQTKDH